MCTALLPPRCLCADTADTADTRCFVAPPLDLVPGRSGLIVLPLCDAADSPWRTLGKHGAKFVSVTLDHSCVVILPLRLPG